MASFDILKTHFAIDLAMSCVEISNFVLGGVAGTFAVTMTYPFDLLRRLMQLSGQPGHPTYPTMFHATYEVVKLEGPRGLYKGYLANMLKVVPTMAILFWCNELLKSHII